MCCVQCCEDLSTGAHQAPLSKATSDVAGLISACLADFPFTLHALFFFIVALSGTCILALIHFLSFPAEGKPLMSWKHRRRDIMKDSWYLDSRSCHSLNPPWYKHTLSPPPHVLPPTTFSSMWWHVCAYRNQMFFVEMEERKKQRAWHRMILHEQAAVDVWRTIFLWSPK